jgi:hypothetical protein
VRGGNNPAECPCWCIRGSYEKNLHISSPSLRYTWRAGGTERCGGSCIPALFVSASPNLSLLRIVPEPSLPSMVPFAAPFQKALPDRIREKGSVEIAAVRPRCQRSPKSPLFPGPPLPGTVDTLGPSVRRSLCVVDCDAQHQREVNERQTSMRVLPAPVLARSLRSATANTAR